MKMTWFTVPAVAVVGVGVGAGVGVAEGVLEEDADDAAELPEPQAEMIDTASKALPKIRAENNRLFCITKFLHPSWRLNS
jgi:hypothetical protein